MTAFTFVLHDESVNTYGFRMLTSGANLEEFRKNPVLFLNHKDWELPIGRWENIRIEGTRILADAVFDENDEEAIKVRKKVETDFVRMASVGAWPPEEVCDAPELKLPGQTLPTVTRWTVREASVVTIGANHNALVMYDRQTGKQIDLTDATSVIRLMDINIHSNTENMNENLKGVLKLQDSATEAEVVGAVKTLIANNDRLSEENRVLKEEKAEQERIRMEAQRAEGVALVDAAVKDGRIDAAGRNAYLALFDKDFESAKAVLAAIPHRQSVVSQIDAAKGQQQTELSDLASKTWDELDRAGRLVELKDKAPELYREKFKARFGTDPNM